MSAVRRLAAAGATVAIALISIGPTFAAPSSKKPAAGPGCIYGQVIDGHSGTVRCLSPEEVTPPGPYDTPAIDAGADAGAPDAATDAALRKEAGVVGADAASPVP